MGLLKKKDLKVNLTYTSTCIYFLFFTLKQAMQTLYTVDMSVSNSKRFHKFTYAC